jgi:hypothetical protein
VEQLQDPTFGKTPALPANIKLGFKTLPVANALANIAGSLTT